MNCPQCGAIVYPAEPNYKGIREGLASRLAKQEAGFACFDCKLHWNNHGEAMVYAPQASQINDGSMVHYVSAPEYNVSPQVLP